MKLVDRDPSARVRRALLYYGQRYSGPSDEEQEFLTDVFRDIEWDALVMAEGQEQRGGSVS